MTDAERDLNALMEECRVYLRSFPAEGAMDAFLTMHKANEDMYRALYVSHNAFPAGVRARLELMRYEQPDVWRKSSRGLMKPIDKYWEADRLVSECEALQKGEGA
jgi:hypothetical protein